MLKWKSFEMRRMRLPIQDEAITVYLQSLLPERSSLLAEVERLCEQDGIPNVDPQAAYLIRTLLQIHKAERILEIGTAYGYSVLHWAEAAPSASITAIELDADRAARARTHFAAAHIEQRVQLLVGDAGQLVPHLEGPFDVAFIDAAKGQYRLFFEEALKKTRSGGLIISDNVLFRGTVALRDEQQIEAKYRKLTQKLQAYNRFLAEHEHSSTTFVPIGDGLAITVKA